MDNPRFFKEKDNDAKDLFESDFEDTPKFTMEKKLSDMALADYYYHGIQNEPQKILEVVLYIADYKDKVDNYGEVEGNVANPNTWNNMMTWLITNSRDKSKPDFIKYLKQLHQECTPDKEIKQGEQLTLLGTKVDEETRNKILPFILEVKYKMDNPELLPVPKPPAPGKK